MQEISELVEAITALEAQRRTLGDRVVDAALLQLEEKLTRLEDQQPHNRQRRLVTVVFVDLVNSTLLSQGLEPEEVMEIMGGALRRFAAPISAFGGEVTQVIGDEIMAVFGLRRIQENDARQAVRAGLAILAESRLLADEMERRYNICGFNIRIGINTGRVVAGKFTNIESTVMGLAVSLAARMEDAAEPGTMVVSQFTYQHIRGAFEARTLPSVEAKGFPQPIGIFKILSARPRTFHTITRGIEGIETRFIGRDDELEQLKQAHSRAFEKHVTLLVTIVGEAGIGKSRLLYEFDRWIASTNSAHVAFKARISPQMSVIPYSLLREMLSYRFNLLTTDTEIETQQKILDGLSQHLDNEVEMKAEFIGALLGFKSSMSFHLKGVENDPNQISERAQIYLEEYFVSLASKVNTIFLLDDIHWSDAPSIKFINRLLSESLRLNLLVLCLARPNLYEHHPDWGRTSDKSQMGLIDQGLQHTQLTLAPLTFDYSQELLNQLLGNNAILPVELRERILNTADGNPYYMEEFIQSLIDVRAIQKSDIDGGWRVFPDKVKTFEIPSTLIALLEARLDNLNIAQKSLILQASVIGQIFWRSALQAVHNYEPVDDEDLTELSKRGFIYRQETSNIEGTDEYRFHHALLRDVAYQALIKADRKTYHSLIANWLIGATQAYSKAGEFEPIIAEHFKSAEENDLAADWYIRSGTQARSQGAPIQALDFFDRALSLLLVKEDSKQLKSDLDRRWKALAGRDEVLGILGDSERRMADDLELVELAQKIGDEHLEAEAFYRMGYYLAAKGLFKQALEAYNSGLAASIQAHDQKREALILGLKVLCEARIGDVNAATKTSELALSKAEETNDEDVFVRNLNNVSLFFSDIGDMARAVQLLDRQLAIIRKVNNIEGEAIGLLNLGYNYTLLGLFPEGISALEKSIDIATKIGQRRFKSICLLNLSLAYLRYGNTNSSLIALEDCLPELQGRNDVFNYSVGLIYRAMCMEEKGLFEEALNNFEQAMKVLGEIGAIGNVCDAISGVARCCLALNKIEESVRNVMTLWECLQRRGTVGMEFPILAYETCANIFAWSNQDSLAKQTIRLGYEELMSRANKISVPEWRQSFMQQITEHRQIVQRWQKMNRNNI